VEVSPLVKSNGVTIASSQRTDSPFASLDM